MAREKFVRKHNMTKEETKELFERIEASRPASPCQIEKAAIEKYKKLVKKLKAAEAEN